jgi:HAD superfamily hydrolase (TIGR01509 family)
MVDDIDRFIRQLHGTKTEVYTQLVASGAAELRPGVRELIAAAQNKGVRLAIATTTSMPNVEALLFSAFREQGADLFEVICAGDSVAAKKPAPDIYEATVKQLQLNSSDCVAIEDSRNGLLSADAAGIATMVTPSIYTQGQCFDEAELTLSDLGENADVVARSTPRWRRPTKSPAAPVKGLSNAALEFVFA